MKIAFWAGKKRQIEAAKKFFGEFHNLRTQWEVDFFLADENPMGVMDCSYDVIVVFANYMEQKRISSQKQRTESVKYAACFNREQMILDIQDIIFFESYDRKTQIVMETEVIRIKGRLDEEEGRLPREQFVRINQGYIVNLQFIHWVKGDEIRMYNDVSLYISSRKKEDFWKRYQQYMLENCMIL